LGFWVRWLNGEKFGGFNCVWVFVWGGGGQHVP